MRLLASVATLALARSLLPAVAFVPTPTVRGPIPLEASAKEDCTDTACEISPEISEAPSLVDAPNGANAIRSAVVTNSAGDFVRIDDAIRSSGAGVDAPHVVVYLRHMG